MVAFMTKTVLITGAARRIGAATARFFHRRDWSVLIHYRTPGEDALNLVEVLNQARPKSAASFRLDLDDSEAMPQLVEAAIRHFGRLDLVINNASSFFPTRLGSVDEKQWDTLLASNLKAPFFLSQAASPWLQKTQGSIVNITDIHGSRPLPHYPVYSTAKSGLNALTRALALEFAPWVRVNAVAPGSILWPEEGHFDAREKENILMQTPLKRLGNTEDIARTVYFLAEDAPFITGQIIAVDGGLELVL
jgi:pteridine reductase